MDHVYVVLATSQGETWVYSVREKVDDAEADAERARKSDLMGTTGAVVHKHNVR